MANASDAQVQRFVDERIRVRVEQIRALRLAIADDIASIADVYAALTQEEPTWSDSRTDGPPHLMTPGDVLAINTLYTDLLAAIDGDAQLPVLLNACVRPV